LGIKNEEASSYALSQPSANLSSFEEDITFTPGSMFVFKDSEIITPFQSTQIFESNNSKSKRIVALTPSKFCPKSIGTPQRVPVALNQSYSEENDIIKNLESSFDNPLVTLEESPNQNEEDNENIPSPKNENELYPPSSPPVEPTPFYSLPQNNSILDCTPFKPPNESLLIEVTPFKAKKDLSDISTQTPGLKSQTSEEEVNPVLYLRSTYPNMTSEDILQICQAIKPEDQLENIDTFQFTDIDTAIFDRTDDYTQNSLRRYSFVKFTKSSLCVQLNTVGRYGHHYGSSLVPKSQYDPTPVRRSKRLEAKTPQTATKKSNRKI